MHLLLLYQQPVERGNDLVLNSYLFSIKISSFKYVKGDREERRNPFMRFKAS